MGFDRRKLWYAILGLILLASWCALRFGELTELRRKDVVLETTRDAEGVELHTGVIRIERAVVRAGDGYLVTTLKSDAGTRDVAIPPRLVPVIRDHLALHVDSGPNALRFPAAHGGHLPGSACTGSSTKLVSLLIFDPMIFGILARCWLPQRVPRWPSWPN